MSIVTHQPLFLVGAFGGAARTVIDALAKGNAAPILSACQPSHLAECIRLSKERTLEVLPDTTSSQDLQLEGHLVLADRIAADILDAGKRGVAAALNNGLDDEMNHQLFQETDPAAIADIILTGLLNCT